MLTGLYDRCVIYFNFREVFSGRIGFRGRRVDRHGPVEWGARPPPLISVCGMCGEFRVSGASFLKSCSEGEGLSIVGFLRVYFLVRVVCFLVLGSGTLGHV